MTVQRRRHERVYLGIATRPSSSSSSSESSSPSSAVLARLMLKGSAEGAGGGAGVGEGVRLSGQELAMVRRERVRERGEILSCKVDLQKHTLHLTWEHPLYVGVGVNVVICSVCTYLNVHFRKGACVEPFCPRRGMFACRQRVDRVCVLVFGPAPPRHRRLKATVCTDVQRNV